MVAESLRDIPSDESVSGDDDDDDDDPALLVSKILMMLYLLLLHLNTLYSRFKYLRLCYLVTCSGITIANFHTYHGFFIDISSVHHSKGCTLIIHFITTHQITSQSSLLFISSYIMARLKCDS